MKRILKCGALLICMWGVFIPTAMAEYCVKSFSFQPYLGLEYIYEHIKPAKPYREFLSANFQNGNFFIGTRINNKFGLEVGYYRDLKSSQQQNQTFSFNDQQASGLTATLTQTSFKGFSIDFASYFSLDEHFYASLIAGFATMHPTMTFDAYNGTDLASAWVLIKGKNRTVPRLGFGLELLTKHWGLRSRVFWVYTQGMKLNVTDAQALFPAISGSPYGQAIQLSVGVFYRF